MARSLAPDGPRATIAVLALGLMAFAPAGFEPDRGDPPRRPRGARRLPAGGGRRSRRVRRRSAASGGAPLARRFPRFARAVVPARPPRGAGLPRRGSFAPARSCSAAAMSCCRCLHSAVVDPGWVSDERVPGGLRRGAGGPRPALHLRRLSRRGRGCAARRRAGAALALVAIFLPGLLILTGALPFWHGLERASSGARGDGRGERGAWSACSPRRSTIRSGRARSSGPPISPSPRPALRRLSRGGRRRSSWSRRSRRPGGAGCRRIWVRRVALLHPALQRVGASRATCRRRPSRSRSRRARRDCPPRSRARRGCARTSASMAGLPHSMKRSAFGSSGGRPLSPASRPDSIAADRRPLWRNGSRVTVG